MQDAGGEVLYLRGSAPARAAARLVAEAKRLGFRLDPAAARLLVERMGTDPMRLADELDRLALWAGEGGRGDASPTSRR